MCTQSCKKDMRPVWHVIRLGSFQRFAEICVAHRMVLDEIAMNWALFPSRIYLIT